MRRRNILGVRVRFVRTLIEVELDPFTIWYAEHGRMSSLEVWHEDVGRVMHLRFEANDITVVTFEPGPWEEAFLELELPSTSKGS